jgi:hypothetical protein
MAEGLSLLLVFGMLVLAVMGILMPVVVFFIHESTKNTLIQSRKTNEKLERLIDIAERMTVPEGPQGDGENQPEPSPQPDNDEVTPAEPFTRLPDDPKKPKRGYIICNRCGLKMPYPKRLAGSTVECHSCKQPFQLPRDE